MNKDSQQTDAVDKYRRENLNIFDLQKAAHQITTRKYRWSITLFTAAFLALFIPNKAARYCTIFVLGVCGVINNIEAGDINRLNKAGKLKTNFKVVDVASKAKKKNSKAKRQEKFDRFHTKGKTKSAEVDAKITPDVPEVPKMDLSQEGPWGKRPPDNTP